MNKRTRKIKINRSDYDRVLVTETLPFEMPLIFSNESLYERIKQLNSRNANTVESKLLRNLVLEDYEGKKVNSTIPYLYKIRKNATEFRELALMHPTSQWHVRNFYKRYETLILYHCANSPASIRTPHKIASSFYFKNSFKNLRQYKADSVLPLKQDETTKHNPSFFSYREYDRLYRFFESRDYFELEKKYTYMQTLDVAKCFPSIYTHSMSWAIKDKTFTKKNVSVEATFAQQFDKLIRHTNHNETNGIIIGPEVSRIFAEIIFQDIDRQVIARMAEKTGKDFDSHYTFRRYVDDVYIFADSKDIATIVYDVYADVLSAYNLHVNTAKSAGVKRPFVTDKSRLIQQAKVEVNYFLDKFLTTDDRKRLVPEKIHSPWRLTRNYINSVKSLCSSHHVNYDEIAGFLIAVFTERIKKLVSIKKLTDTDINASIYLDAILVLLDIEYFLYQISPSVGASYKVCTALILSDRFMKRHLPSLQNTVALRIYELTEELLNETIHRGSELIESRVPLEQINIILAVSEIGKNYLMPEHLLKRLFSDDIKESSYFSIVSCLFYIKTHERYNDLRELVLKQASEKLADLSDIRMNSEKANLLLDLIGCPFVSDTNKSKWLKRAFKALDMAQPSKTLIQEFLSLDPPQPIHVKWDNLDLLVSLEKKELKHAY